MSETNISQSLRTLANQMDYMANAMEKYAKTNLDGEVRDHANELRGAANIARSWADGIEDAQNEQD